jgi:hypothetical protein
MSWNSSIRQFHRWLSVAFTLAVILNLLVMGREPVALWVGIATLIPLVLLMLTGLYLFILPYTLKRRGGQ